jgi:cytochrome c biogenesis protein CcmG/thiol:disulfide interchange protein DsbE
MSNTVYTRKARPAGSGVDEADEGLRTVQYVEAQPAGLFSSPGRAMALVGSVVLLLAVFSVVIFLLGSRKNPTVSGLTDCTNVAGAPRVGECAPDFQLVNVRDNRSLQLSSLRGKPVFVNFWGTWCPPCRAEMPEMQKFYQQHKDEIEVIGVSMAPRDDPGIVLSFIQQNPYSWTFVHDSDYSIAQRYIVQAVPSSYFIDEAGVIRVAKIGPMDMPMMEAYLQQTRQAR